MKKMSTAILSTCVAALLATAGVAPSFAHDRGEDDDRNRGQEKTVTLTAKPRPLNSSGVRGSATAVVRNQLIRSIKVHATGLTPDGPHAQQIHYGDDARNECPTMADDTNKDGFLNTVEGQPAYGPIVVSLTTRGDTTPASALAVNRLPVAVDGELDYRRRNIEFTDVSGTGYTGGTGTAKQIADSIREGEGAVVIHGIDYNKDGMYNGDRPSELDPSLPAEATDPPPVVSLRRSTTTTETTTMTTATTTGSTRTTDP